MKKRYQPPVALATILFFAVTNLHCLPRLEAAPEFAVIPHVNDISSGFQLELPPELGTVQSLHAGQGTTLYHIQTAHGSYEAQKSIAATLSYLHQKIGLDALLLEGSPYKLRPELLHYFSAYPDLNARVLDRLSRAAWIKGPELFLASMEAPIPAYGVEDLYLYRDNLNRFRQVLRAGQKAEDFLSRLGLEVSNLSARLMNPDFKEFLALKQRWEQGEISPAHRFEILRARGLKVLGKDAGNAEFQLLYPMMVRYFRLKAIEKDWDPQAYIIERQLFIKLLSGSNIRRQVEEWLTESLPQHPLPDPDTGIWVESLAGSLPSGFVFSDFPNIARYMAFAVLRSELKGESFLQEASRLEQDVLEGLARTPEEKGLLELMKKVWRLHRLLRLELTPEDYSVMEPSYKPSALVRTLQNMTGEDIVKTCFHNVVEIDLLHDAALDFYKGANRRDEAMLAQIEKLLANHQIKKAVLITGGFHSGAMQQYFKNRNLNYALIAPQMTPSASDAYVGSLKDSDRFAQGFENYRNTVLQGDDQSVKAATLETFFFAHTRNEFMRVIGASGMAGNLAVQERFLEEEVPRWMAERGMTLSGNRAVARDFNRSPWAREFGFAADVTGRRFLIEQTSDSADRLRSELRLGDTNPLQLREVEEGLKSLTFDWMDSEVRLEQRRLSDVGILLAVLLDETPVGTVELSFKQLPPALLKKGRKPDAKDKAKENRRIVESYDVSLDDDQAQLGEDLESWLDARMGESGMVWHESVLNPRSELREKILLVDDNEAVRSAHATQLRAHGFEVREASDGDVAKRLVGSEAFDLVITDIGMPHLNGVAMIREINPAHPNLPFIIWGKGTLASVRAHLGSLLAEHHIPVTVMSKDITIEEAVAEIRLVFQSRQPRQVVSVSPERRSELRAQNQEFLNTVLLSLIHYLELTGIDDRTLGTGIVHEIKGRLELPLRRLKSLHSQTRKGAPVATIRGEQSDARSFDLHLRSKEDVEMFDPRVFELFGTDGALAIEVERHDRETTRPSIFGKDQKSIREQLKFITVLNFLTQMDPETHQGKHNQFNKFLGHIDIQYFKIIRKVREVYKKKYGRNLNDQIIIREANPARNEEAVTFEDFRTYLREALADQNVISKDDADVITRLKERIDGFIDLNDLAIELLLQAYKTETISRETAKIILFLQQIGIGLVSEEIARDIREKTRYISLGNYNYGFQFNPGRAKRGGSFSAGMIGRRRETILSGPYVADFYPLQRHLVTVGEGGIVFKEYANPFPHQPGSVNAVLERIDPQNANLEDLEARLKILRDNTPTGEESRYRDFINVPFAGFTVDHLHYQGFLKETNLEIALSQPNALEEIRTEPDGVRTSIVSENFFEGKSKFPLRSTFVVEGKEPFNVASAVIRILKEANENQTLPITRNSKFTYNLLLADDGINFKVYVMVRELVVNPFDPFSPIEPNMFVLTDEPEYQEQVQSIKREIGQILEEVKPHVETLLSSSASDSEKAAAREALKGLSGQYEKRLARGIKEKGVIFYGRPAGVEMTDLLIFGSPDQKELYDRIMQYPQLQHRIIDDIFSQATYKGFSGLVEKVRASRSELRMRLSDDKNRSKQSQSGHLGNLFMAGLITAVSMAAIVTPLAQKAFINGYPRAGVLLLLSALPILVVTWIATFFIDHTPPSQTKLQKLGRWAALLTAAGIFLSAAFFSHYRSRHERLLELKMELNRHVESALYYGRARKIDALVTKVLAYREDALRKEALRYMDQAILDLEGMTTEQDRKARDPKSILDIQRKADLLKNSQRRLAAVIPESAPRSELRITSAYQGRGDRNPRAFERFGLISAGNFLIGLITLGGIVYFGKYSQFEPQIWVPLVTVPMGLTAIGFNIWASLKAPRTSRSNPLDQRGLVRHRLSRSELRQAVPSGKRVAKAYVKIQAVFDQADTHYLRKEYLAAIKAYRRVIQLYQDIKDALLNRMKSRDGLAVLQQDLDEMERQLKPLDLLKDLALSRIDWLRKVRHEDEAFVRTVDDGPGGEVVLGDPVHYIEAHRSGTRHGSTQIIVATLDGEILVQQKPSGRLEISAAGQIRKNEQGFKEAAINRILTETGLGSMREDALIELKGVTGAEKIGYANFDGEPYYDDQGVFHYQTGELANREHSKFYLYILNPEEERRLKQVDVANVGKTQFKFIPLRAYETTTGKRSIRGLIERLQHPETVNGGRPVAYRRYSSALQQFFRQPKNTALLEREILSYLLREINQTKDLQVVEAIGRGIGVLKSSAIPKIATTPSRLKTPSKGVFVFDVDKTLADRDKRLSASMRKLIRFLLKSGYEVVIMTGQPVTVQYPRLVADITIKEGKGAAEVGSVEKLDATDLDNLVIYANEGSQKYVFVNGEIREVEDYRKGVLANEEIKIKAEGIITTLLQQLRDFTDKAVLQTDLQAFLDNQGKAEDIDSILAALKDLLVRDWPTILDRDTQIAFKLNELKSHPQSKIIRHFVTSALASRLKIAGIEGIKVASSGSTTIGLTPENVDKALSMADVLKYVPAAQVVYFGDEFEPGGNDYLIAKFRNRKWNNARDLTVFSVGVKDGKRLRPRGTIWLGEGPQAVEKALSDLKRRFSANRPGQNPERIFKLWKEKLSRRSELRKPHFNQRPAIEWSLKVSAQVTERLIRTRWLPLGPEVPLEPIRDALGLSGLSQLSRDGEPVSVVENLSGHHADETHFRVPRHVKPMPSESGIFIFQGYWLETLKKQKGEVLYNLLEFLSREGESNAGPRIAVVDSAENFMAVVLNKLTNRDSGISAAERTERLPLILEKLKQGRLVHFINKEDLPSYVATKGAEQGVAVLHSGSGIRSGYIPGALNLYLASETANSKDFRVLLPMLAVSGIRAARLAKGVPDPANQYAELAIPLKEVLFPGAQFEFLPGRGFILTSVAEFIENQIKTEQYLAMMA